MKVCPECHGQGRIEDEDGNIVTCPECHGFGVVDDRIEIIRKRAERLGTIEAASEKEAIEKGGERSLISHLSDGTELLCRKIGATKK